MPFRHFSTRLMASTDTSSRLRINTSAGFAAIKSAAHTALGHLMSSWRLRPFYYADA